LTTANIILGLIALFASAFLLRRKLRKDAAQLAHKTEGLFADVIPLLAEVTSSHGESAGSWRVKGIHDGNTFQLRSIIDTLATRKLPSLWLQVTLAKPQPIDVTVDIMRRPNGPTTFSNFDFLPHSLRTASTLPEDAVIRSDSDDPSTEILDVVARNANVFSIPRMKELLISPNGLRVVLQVSEGDHLRHGVFRQADFGDAKIDVTLVKLAMAALLAIDANLREHHKHD
jgi:hypothetical protein